MLAELQEVSRRFEPPSARRLGKLLSALDRRRFTDPSSLLHYHEALLFCRAFPQNAELLRQCDDLLAGVGEKAVRMKQSGVSLELFDQPEASGVAHTSFCAIFSYPVARALVQLDPERVRLDWEAFEPSGAATDAWRRLFPLAEEDTLVEPEIPYKDWLRAASGGEDRALGCLLDRLEAQPLEFKDKAALYAVLAPPLRWDLGDSRLSRTLMRAPMEEPFFHKEPFLRRADIRLSAELSAAPIEYEVLNQEAGQAFLNMAVAASAVRQRELHGFSYGDPRGVVRARLGRGVDAYVCGVPPGCRLPLRGYHAAMMVKNGIPIGYFEVLSLCERLDVGFNIYYTFRDGETGWLFARMLHLFHQLLGSTCFVIDPYQIGRHNEEAIQSGAFWFYRKLGFRPVLPEVVRVLEPEECRMLKKAGYRTPPGTLRKLAAGPLVYEMDGGTRGDWDRFHIRRVGLAAQRYGPAEAAARVSEALGINAGPHGEFLSLAHALALIPDLAEWTPQEKAELVNIIRAKMGPDESLYTRRTQQHPRFRQAILRLGTPEGG